MLTTVYNQLELPDEPPKVGISGNLNLNFGDIGISMGILPQVTGKAIAI